MRSATRAGPVGPDQHVAPTPGPASTLRGLVESRLDAPGAALARLLAHDADESVRELALMLLFCAACDPQVTRRARTAVLRTALPELKRAFADPQVPDERKVDIGPLLRMCGEVIPPHEYSRAFRDYDGCRARLRDEAVRRSLATPEVVTEHLLAGGVIGGEGEISDAVARLLDVGERAVQHNPPLGAMILCVLTSLAAEHELDGFPTRRALDLAEATGSREAAWFLHALGELPVVAEWCGSARAASRRLAEAGVAPVAPLARPFLQGAVTRVDEWGSRQIILTFEDGQGTDLLFLSVNDRSGIEEAYCRFTCDLGTVRELEAALAEIARAPCDLPLARSFVSDALATHARTGHAPGGTWVLYRYLLGAEPLTPVARAPVLDAYALDTVELEPSLVACAELADEPLCACLYRASDEACRFVEALRDRQEAVLSPAASHVAAFAAIVVRERETLLGRLAANLELEALAGREGEEVNRRLARVYHGLRHEVVPFVDAPFVLGLCALSIQAIGSDLSSGSRA
jgi:hypothetical protein